MAVTLILKKLKPLAASDAERRTDNPHIVELRINGVTLKSEKMKLDDALRAARQASRELRIEVHSEDELQEPISTPYRGEKIGSHRSD